MQHPTDRPLRLQGPWLRVLLSCILFYGSADSVAGGNAGAAPGMTPTLWAHDFVDSVGVNIHLHHPDSFYGMQFELMKQRLLDARIRHVRDGMLDQRGGFFTGDQADRYRELGQAGIGVTFITRAGMPNEILQGYPARVSPAFEAYELPNELNLTHNPPWLETLNTWMPIFRQYVKGGAASRRYPIIGPSLVDFGNDPYGLLGNETDNLDFGNIHKYYRNYNPGTAGYGGPGKPPCDAYHYGSLDYVKCEAIKTSTSKPIICTEAGYGSNASLPKEVTPEVQAKYISRMLMLHLKAGISRTFIYQLADYGADGFGDFGLLTSNGDEKPAFRELSALMNELDDGKPVIPLKNLAISIAGNTDDLQSLSFAKSDGSYRVVLWLEKPSIDTRKNQPIDVPSQTVTLTVPPSYEVHRIVTFQDSGDSNISRVSASASVTVSVRDNLSLADVQITGKRPKPPVLDRSEPAA